MDAGDKRRLYRRLYYERNRDALIAKAAVWAAANPDRVRANKSRYADRHRAELRRRRNERRRLFGRKKDPKSDERVKRWVAAHPDRRKEISKRHARKKAAAQRAELIFLAAARLKGSSHG